MVDVARQLPEIKEFFSKWYPSYARLADHDRVIGLVESGDEQGLIDLLYDSSWERVKHKLDNRGRVTFKREFDQMLDAIFPGRAGERVDDLPIMAGLKKKAHGVPKCGICGKAMGVQDFDEDGTLYHCMTPTCMNLIDDDNDKWAENCQAFVETGEEVEEEDPDATIYREPTKKHDVKTQPYAPGHKSPADRRKEIEEAYHMLHGKSRFTLYRNKDRAIRTNRVHVRKRLLTPKACSWCSMLSPEKSINLVKVAMNSHSVCKRCTDRMLEEINGSL